MNKTNPTNQTRAVCPECGNTNTFAHYVHQGCPNSPTGTTTWEKEAWLGPDGRPVAIPCPDCQFSVYPSYLICKDCNHQW
jgi:ribosomal protein S27E